MIHRTYRRLDEPPKIGPFGLSEWVCLILDGAAIYGLAQLIQIPLQPMMVLITVFVGGPGMLMYISEGSRPSYLRVCRACLRWMFTPKIYAGGYGTVKPFTLHETDSKGSKARQKIDADTRLEALEETA